MSRLNGQIVFHSLAFVCCYCFFLQLFDGRELVELIKQLIAIDADWVPKASKEQPSSLYIRPTLIGTEVKTLANSHDIILMKVTIQDVVYINNWNWPLNVSQLFIKVLSHCCAFVHSFETISKTVIFLSQLHIYILWVAFWSTV